MPSTKDDCLMGSLWLWPLMKTQSALFQGTSVSCDNPISPRQPYDLWQVLLHLWKSQGVNGPPAFCKVKGRVGLSTVHRDRDKGRLFELKN